MPSSSDYLKKSEFLDNPIELIAAVIYKGII